MPKDYQPLTNRFHSLNLFMHDAEKIFEEEISNHYLFQKIVTKLHQHFGWSFAWWKYDFDNSVAVCLKLQAMSGEIDPNSLNNNVITKQSNSSQIIWESLTKNEIKIIDWKTHSGKSLSLLQKLDHCMVVPMMYSAEFMGTMMVFPAKEELFSKTDTALMEIISKILNQLFQLNYDVSKSLLEVLGGQTQEEAFDKIIDISTKLLKAKGAVLYLNSEEDERITAAAVNGIKIQKGRVLRKGYTFKYGEGMAGYLMTHDEEYIIEHNFHDSKYYSNKFEGANFSKVIEVPLFLRNRTKIGVLAVVNEFERFNYSQVKILKQLADHVMLILEYNQNIQILEKQLKDSDEFQEMVKRLYAEVNNSSGLYTKIIEEVGRFSKGKQITLFLPELQKEKVVLKPVATDGDHSFISIKDHIFIPGEIEKEGIAGFVFKTGHKINLNSPKGHASYIGKPSLSTEPDSMIALPIYLDEQVIGVLCVDYQKNNRATIEEIKKIEILLQQAAAVLQVNKGLNLVSAVNESIIGHSQLEPMIQSICDKTTTHTLSQGIDIHLINGTDKNYHVSKTIRIPNDPMYPPSRFGRSPHSLVRDVITKKSPLIIPNIKDYKGHLFLNPDITEYKKYQSLIGLKLVYGEEVIGALFINFTSKRKVTDIEVSFLEQLANQLAIGIKKAELRSRQIKQRDLIIDAVDYISELVGNTVEDNEEEMLHNMLRPVLGLVDELSLGEVRLYDEKEQGLAVKACYPADAYLSKSDTIMPLNKGLTSAAYLSNSFLIANDTSKYPKYEACHSSTNSEAVFPIRRRGQAIGVLNIEHPSKNVFHEADKKLGLAFSKLIGVGLEHNRILKTELEAYLEFGKILGIKNNLDEVLDSVLTLVNILFNSPQVSSFWELEAGSLGLLVERKSIGKEATQFRTNRFDQGILGWVANHREPVKINDVSTDKRYFPGIKNTMSELCVPVFVWNQLYGVLNIEQDKKNAFTSYDLKMAEVISAIAAVAIDNVKLRTELQRENEHKTNLLDIVAHELGDRLFNPSILWRDFKNIVPQELEIEYLNCLREIEDLEGLNTNLLALANIEMGADSFKIKANPSQDLFSILREVVYEFQNRAAEKSLRIDLISPTIPISGLLDYDLIKRVVANLVSNAIKYSNEKNTIEIRCLSDMIHEEIGFSVNNRGVIIPKAEYENIFKRRYQFKDPYRVQPGIGIGLFIVKTFCELHKGTVLVESNKKEGTTFTVRIPINHQIL